MDIIVSNSNSPFFNIAAEKYLLTERLSGDVLFLYINTPSVIVGRNQNPEAEADLEYCRVNGIPVIKRLSGGGTVYHDPGNINYCFIADKGDGLALDADFLTPVVEVLGSFGISVDAGVRKELLIGGKKISGTASHVTKTRQLFHGTLLYDSDLEVLSKALSGDKSKRGRKVASVPSEVANIISYLPGRPSAPEFFEQLINGFKHYYSETKIETLHAINAEK